MDTPKHGNRKAIANHKFVTLTFEKRLHKKTPKYLFMETISGLLDQLKKSAYNYSLVPELTDNGVLHYHYMINIKDKIKHKILINYWRRNNGFVDIKPVYDVIGLHIYLRKDSNTMFQNLFTKYEKIPHTLFKIITLSTSQKLLKDISHYKNVQKNKIFKQTVTHKSKDPIHDDGIDKFFEYHTKHIPIAECKQLEDDKPKTIEGTTVKIYEPFIIQF